MRLSAEHFFEITKCHKVEDGNVAHPKRGAGRVGCVVRIQFQRVVNGKLAAELHPARTRDVSATGACLVTRTQLDADDRIVLRFERGKKTPLRIECAVVRCQKADDSFIVGVQFTRVLEEAAAANVTALPRVVASATPVLSASGPVAEASEVERIRRAVFGEK